MAHDLDIRIPLQPKQKELYDLVENSPAKWFGNGGSRGSAKSHGGRSIMLLRRLKYPRTRGLIFRRTFEQLWENHIQPLFTQFPFMRNWYNTQHKELTLPNGSSIVFGYAQHKGDIENFEGKEYMDILVDEATHLHQHEIERLSAANRVGGASRNCKMILTCTPGNVGHAFIRRVFIKREYHENENPSDYVFLQARAWDNVQWAKAALAEAGLTDKAYYSWTDEQRFDFFIGKTDYGRTLCALPESLRLGWLLGDWNIFAGQYFDIFSRDRHVVPPSSIPLEAWASRWISIDWGFDHPSAIYWHTASPDGRICTYREMVCRRMAPQHMGAEIARLSVDSQGRAERIQAVYLSPDAFAQRTAEHTIAEQLGDALAEAGIPRPGQADNDRVGGWMLMYQLFEADQWVISETCGKLIECLPTLTRDEDYTEDILKVDGDDPADAARYGMKSHLAPGRKPIEQRIADRIHATDPTSVAILSRKYALEESKKTAPVLPRRWRPHRGPA